MTTESRGRMGRSLTLAAGPLFLPVLALAQSAASSPGNQVAVAPGTALEFRLARPLVVEIVG
jgi:hypothetical protein